MPVKCEGGSGPTGGGAGQATDEDLLASEKLVSSRDPPLWLAGTRISSLWNCAGFSIWVLTELSSYPSLRSFRSIFYVEKEKTVGKKEGKEST